MTAFRLKTTLAIAASTAISICDATASTTGEVADTLMRLPPVSVTAIKGETSRKPALAATTLGRAEIERLNIVNIKQVSEIAPNFYMPQYGSRMTSSVYVRGLGTRIDQPVVGLNIDNYQQRQFRFRPIRHKPDRNPSRASEHSLRPQHHGWID